MANLTYDFSGRTVLVTGAARGVGRAVGQHFRAAGASVYLVDVEPDVLSETAREIGAVGLAADVTDSAQVDAVVARVVSETGRIDVLVNNAGILRDGVVWKLSDDDYESVMAVHAGGTFRFTRAAVPQFRRQGSGRIINVTSYTGLRGNPGQSNYAMAKAGIIGFTKTTAKELARFGTTVNAISPNARTRMISSVPPGKLAELTRQIPMGRFADAAEMSAAVAFLASDEAAYITGIVLPVDGGLSL
jgi:3-oxoacyl-[acyl-carrier protein] reductase